MSTATRIPSLDRRSARRTRMPFVIAADETALHELMTVVAGLPLCAAGRVFVEVPDAGWIVPLEAPGRMTVTWLDRSRRSGDPGSGRECVRGQALSRAVMAWADEMLCDGDTQTRVVLMGGYLPTVDVFEYLTQVRGMAQEFIRTPHAYGLAASRMPDALS